MDNFISKYWSALLSVVAIGLSLIALIRIEPIKIEYLSFFVGVLASVVAVFVAAQIYHSFTLRRDIDKDLQKRDEQLSGIIHSIADDMKQTFEDTIIKERDWVEVYTNMISKQGIGVSMYYAKEHYPALISLLKALSLADELKDKGKINSIVEYLDYYAANDIKVVVSKEDKHYFIQTFSALERVDKLYITEYLARIWAVEEGELKVKKT